MTTHWRFLIKFLRPQWQRVLLLSLLILTGIGLQLLNPQVMRYFIDTTQSTGATPALIVAALVYLGVGLAQHGLTLANTALSLDVGWRATNALRADLLRHVLRLDIPFHKAHTPGALIERVDGDVSALGEFFSQFLVRVVANLLLIAAILVIVLRTSALAGVALVVYTVVVGLVLVYMQRIGAARMLVRTPDLLVCDDLSSALDVETERQLWERVAGAHSREQTLLVVSHRRPVLRLADTVIVLKNGRVETAGALDETLEISPELCALWSGQAQSG